MVCEQACQKFNFNGHRPVAATPFAYEMVRPQYQILLTLLRVLPVQDVNLRSAARRCASYLAPCRSLCSYHIAG